MAQFATSHGWAGAVIPVLLGRMTVAGYSFMKQALETHHSTASVFIPGGRVYFHWNGQSFIEGYGLFYSVFRGGGPDYLVICAVGRVQVPCFEADDGLIFGEAVPDFGKRAVRAGHGDHRRAGLDDDRVPGVAEAGRDRYIDPFVGGVRVRPRQNADGRAARGLCALACGLHDAAESPAHDRCPAQGQQPADLGRELFSAVRGVVTAADYADQQLPFHFAHYCSPSAAICASISTATPILPSSNRRSSCLLSKGSRSAVPCTSTYLKSPVITTLRSTSAEESSG